MNCPRCQNAPLRSGVCAECRGEFLSAPDVRDLLAAAHVDRAEFVKAYESAGEPSMPCPSCAMRMWAFELEGERVDFCVDCDALWLDAGEGARILGEYRLAVPEAERTRPAVNALVPRPLDLSRHLAFEPPRPPNNHHVVWAIGVCWGLALAASNGSGALGIFVGIVAAAFGLPIWFRRRAAITDRTSLRAQRPVMRALTDGLGVDYGETKKRIRVESGDVAELKIVSSAGVDAQHQLWLHVGQNTPFCLLAAKSRRDLEQPTLAVENWLRGVLGLEVFRRGGESL